MGLSGIVFTKDPKREIEVEGHKIIVKRLTSRDSLEMESAINSVSAEKVDFKVMLTAFIDILSVVILEVDGVKAESKADTKEFLLGLEQAHVTDIFTKAKVFGEVTPDEVKKSPGTQA